MRLGRNCSGPAMTLKAPRDCLTTPAREAIASAVDYPTIIANGMTNQSATFTQVPRSLMNPTEGEQAMYDHAAVADLQWAGNDVEGAKKLLDDAGALGYCHLRC